MCMEETDKVNRDAVTLAISNMMCMEEADRAGV